jgi:hypothetical protein
MRERFDHSPHDLFVEMNELQGEEWVENARWIKYEEDREEGAERWGKAHVSSLSFHSLINLRLCLESGERKAKDKPRDLFYDHCFLFPPGVLILDLEAQNLTEVVYRVVEEMSCDGVIEEEQKSELMRVLLYRHKYVSSGNKGIKIGGLRKNLSQRSLNVSSFA